MKKILFIANYRANAGGISTQVDVLDQLLRQEGYATQIHSLSGSMWIRMKACFRLLNVGRHYDIFHIHACSYNGFFPVIIGVKIGRLLGKRIVVTFHGGGANVFFKKRTRLVKKYLAKTDVNIVLSDYLSETFKQYGIPCVIVPNIIEIRDDVFRERNTISPRYISIRSLTRTYNILCTIKAFQKVKKKYSAATLTLLGDGPLRKELEDYVAANRIEDVAFVGRVPNDAIYQYLNAADIMLSSPLADNMPMSLLEGFNAGLLVVSSSVGGVPYMIKDGVNGFLFPSRNFEKMAEKMIEAVEKQEKTKEMIRAAHDGLKSYTWESNKRKYFNIYYGV